MYPKINDWKARIQKVSEEAAALCAHKSSDELNTKPNATTWSMAQVLDHLIVTNSSYYPVIQQIREGKYRLPFMARFKFMVRFFGNFILQSVEPTRKRKIKTFPIWEPSKSTISGDILQRFLAHQQEFISWMEGCDELLQKNTLLSSPANRNIVYTLDKAFDIIVAHEERHVNQLKEIAALTA